MTNTPYYILKPAVGTKETGMAYPAVESYDHYDFNAPDSMHKLRSYEFPDFTPDIRFKLSKKAKLTDILSQATINAHGLLISDKVKTMLEQHNLPQHFFYDATIETKNEVHKYYWLHIVYNDSVKLINYINSSFFIRRGLKNIGEIKINNFEDFNIKKSTMGSINYIDFEKINLISTIPFNLFVLKHGIDIYITDELKKQITNEKLTGIDILSTDKLFIS